MSEFNDQSTAAEGLSPAGIRSIVQEAMEEFARRKQEESEPAQKAELLEERRRREQLEAQMKDLLQKARESEQEVARARMTSAVKEELQKLGVTKVDLAFRVMKDDIRQSTEGQFVARSREGEIPLTDFVKRFVDENPEFLPPRIAGGSGTSGGGQEQAGIRADLDAIRPGMSLEERREIQRAIASVISQTLKS
ncbi:MAG: hypothetical protein LC114_21150 [Bryobacterales bacterium]|nr:hypothetical protein [Bryobacterales bacterium]